MSDFDQRAILSLVCAGLLLYMLASRILLFSAAAKMGRRVRYNYVFGYGLMSCGSIWTGVHVFLWEPLSWAGITVYVGLIIVLWPMMREWTAQSMPPWTTTTDPGIVERWREWRDG